MTKKILITGSNGQLGQEFQQLSKTVHHHFIFTNRDALDITDFDKLSTLVNQHQPNVIVNCAAYTAVDKAETEKELAYKINEEGARNLAKAAKAARAKLIHISTDFVFDGSSNEPLTEDINPNPLGVYGASKLAGENAVQEENKDSIIIRTAWVYSTFGSNFVKTMLRLAADRDKLSVVYDQVGTPTYALDLAKACLSIISHKDFNNQSGIYNYSNEGVCSWYDFAAAIFEISGKNLDLSPILAEQYPTPAKRPSFSVLNKQKIKYSFQINIPHWRDSLRQCLANME